MTDQTRTEKGEISAAAQALTEHLETVDEFVEQHATTEFLQTQLDRVLAASTRQAQPSGTAVSSRRPPRKETDRARWIRAQGLARGLSSTRIAAEIAEQCGPLFNTSRIRAHRLARGISLSDVVTGVQSLYKAEGKPLPKLGETLLAAYESRYRRPGPEYLHYLCLLYRCEPADLGYDIKCACESAHRGVSGISEDEAGVIREALPRLLSGQVNTHDRFLGAVGDLRESMDSALQQPLVASSTVDRWEQLILQYCTSFQQTPPLRLLHDALLDYADVRQACKQRQPAELQPRVHRISAQLAGIVGILLTVLGDERQARAFFRTAAHAAKTNGEIGPQAWTMARESLVPLYYGDPREALFLARKARSLARTASTPVSALAPALEARALSRLAPVRPDAMPSAKAALARSRTALLRLPEPDQGDHVFGFTTRQMHFYEGDTFTHLGSHLQGDEALRRAFELYSPTEVIDRTLIRLDRAACALQAGEPDRAAMMTMRAILDLDPEQRSHILMRRARQIANAVTQEHGRISGAGDLAEALTTSSIEDLLTTGA